MTCGLFAAQSSRSVVVRLLLIAGVVVTNETGAQTPPRRDHCWAPPSGSEIGGVSWIREANVVAAGDARPTSEELGRRLAGTWDFLSVMTEGGASPSMVRWTLRLIPTDSVARTNCVFGKCRRGFGFPAAGQILRPGARFDSLAAAQHRTREETDASVSYNSEQNTVTISFGRPMFDAGDVFSVSLFSDTAFAGRWESGGMFYVPVSRGGIDVLEKPSGYFCARRVSR